MDPLTIVIVVGIVALALKARATRVGATGSPLIARVPLGESPTPLARMPITQSRVNAAAASGSSLSPISLSMNQVPIQRPILSRPRMPPDLERSAPIIDPRLLPIPSAPIVRPTPMPPVTPTDTWSWTDAITFAHNLFVANFGEPTQIDIDQFYARAAAAGYVTGQAVSRARWQSDVTAYVAELRARRNVPPSDPAPPIAPPVSEPIFDPYPDLVFERFVGGIQSWTNDDVLYALAHPDARATAPGEWPGAANEAQRRGLIATTTEPLSPSPPSEHDFSGGVMAWTNDAVWYAAFHPEASANAPGEWPAAPGEARRRGLV